MLNYLKASFRRKKARRITQEYPPNIVTFQLEKVGPVQFAQWENPLAPKISILQDDVDFYKRYIKEGDLIIDIGANIGDTTVPMAIAAGKKGITLGFDPNPFVYKILAENAGLNKKITNIIPFNLAISAHEESFYFISSEASFANGGISLTKESHLGKFVFPDKVKGIHLMSLLEKEYANHLDKLSFIKIDTEGYDKEIIKSISDLILKYKPTIVAESFGASKDADKMELYEVLCERGYEIYYFGNANHPNDPNFEPTSNVEIKKLQKREDMTKWKKTINIVAIPIRD